MRFAVFGLFLTIIGCGVAPQPQSARTVAAFEINLSTQNDRTEFLADLREAAKVQGLHVDADSYEELQDTAQADPKLNMTIHAAVYRGASDKYPEAVIMDQSDHLGQVWITFQKGNQPKRAAKFRERLMRTILLRWPDTLSLPIMPTGAIPLHSDLIRRGKAYVVNPSAAFKYRLDPPPASH